MNNSNAAEIFNLAEELFDDAVDLLSDIISIEGQSGQEGPRLEYLQRQIQREQAADDTFIDDFGNLCWVVGNGPKVLWYLGAADCACPGPIEAWDALNLYPHDACIRGDMLYGRGAADALGGLVSQVFATRIIRELELAGQYTLYSVACPSTLTAPGAAPQWIMDEAVASGRYKLPDAVVLTRPTGDKISGPLGISLGDSASTTAAQSQTWTGKAASTPTAPRQGHTHKSAALVQAAIETYEQIIAPAASAPTYAECFRPAGRVGSWSGASQAAGVPQTIPLIGLSPGMESQSGVPGESLDLRELTGAIAYLALLPMVWSSPLPAKV